MANILREKYKAYQMTKYRIIAHGQKKGRTMICSLCGDECRESFDSKAKEIICSLCTMGLADSYCENKEKYIDLIELLEVVREGRLSKYRSKIGLTRGDLGRYIGVAPKYLQRIENLQHYPIDRLVKAINKKIATVHSSVVDH
jgi:hypothetical protein